MWPIIWTLSWPIVLVFFLTNKIKIHYVCTEKGQSWKGTPKGQRRKQGVECQSAGPRKEACQCKEVWSENEISRKVNPLLISLIINFDVKCECDVCSSSVYSY